MLFPFFLFKLSFAVLYVLTDVKAAFFISNFIIFKEELLWELLFYSAVAAEKVTR